MATRKKDREREERSSAIVIPSVRTYRLWTPGQLKQAELLADTGNIRHAVDLCDWLLADDRVRGALDARIAAWMNLTPSFDPAGDKRRQKRVVKKLEAQEDYYAIFRDAETRQANYWALLLNLGPAFLDWQVLEDHEDRDIPVFTFYHPQSLRYDWQQRTWMRRTGDTGPEEQITFGDGIWVGHMPFGTFRPWSLGLWRGLSRWVLLKAYAISDYGRVGESAARNVVEQELAKDGTLDLEEDDGQKSSAKLRKELARDIQQMGREGTLVLPAGFHYRRVEQSATTKDIYKDQIELANTAIAVAIRGGNLTTQVGGQPGGTKGAAEVQERTGDQANAHADASAWETTSHDQVLVFWSDSNFGDRKLAPWPDYPTEPEEDRADKAEVFDTVMEASGKAEDRGYDVDRDALAREFGLDGFLKPGTKVTPPAPGSPDDGDDENDDDGKGEKKKPGAKEKKKPKAQARRSLASGDALRNGRGFVDGQLYADALVERSTEAGIEALEPTLDAILEELDAAKDYDDLRARLRARYKDLDPEDISAVVSAAMTLGELAGRVATNQDA
jgi:hypothetical protein